MATTGARLRVFFDTNVLIQLHVATAPKHNDTNQAVKRLLEENDEIWISRQVLREYAAVLTRDQPYTPPIAPTEVAKQLRLFETHYRLADENSHITAALCTLLDTIPLGGKQVHDANIVASMQVYGITHLFTLNSGDFARFAKLITVITLEELLKRNSEDDMPKQNSSPGSDV
jgi:predicted nucleic acid-binding protein